MAYPSIHYGNFGDEKVTSTAKIAGLPLGIKMVLPDGREFVHARAGGTALVAGRLYQATTAQNAVADTLYHNALLPTAAYAIGATTVSMSAGGTTGVTTDQFMDGFLVTASSTGTGIGYSYKIKANNSVAAGSTLSFSVTLYETDGLNVATNSASTRFGLLENKYANVELSVASSVGWETLGVACNSAAASAYTWLQTRGEAAVYTGTALVERQSVKASTVTAGAVTLIDVASTAALRSTKEGFDVVGIGMTIGAITGFSMVDLKLR